MKKLFAITMILTAIAVTLFTQFATAGVSMAVVGGVVISTDRMRAVFERAKKDYAGQGKIIVPHYIRIEQAIANGRTKYSFQITKDTNSDTVTEQKLDRNDKFLATSIGLFLMKRLSTKTGNEVLYSFPNTKTLTEFADVSTTFLGKDLETFFNGFLSIKVGQTIYLEKFPTKKFREVGVTQQSDATTQNSSTGDSGFVDLTPQLLLDGDRKTDITLEAPVHSTSLPANTTASTTNYLVFMAFGFLITTR
jgi:hypothetical protein